MDSYREKTNGNGEPGEGLLFDGVGAMAVRGGSSDGGSAVYAAIPPFLLKIHDMLNNKETKSVISWRESGTSFVVANPHAFATTVLPLYFRHNNFQSFVAQLNSYGFRKTSWEHWEYSHEYFRKGERHLLGNIKRRNQVSSNAKPSSSGGHRQISCMERELEAMENEHARLKAEMEELRDVQRILEQKLASLVNQAAKIKSDGIVQISEGLLRNGKLGDDDKPIETIMSLVRDEFGGYDNMSGHFGKEKAHEETGKNSSQMTDALVSLEEMMFGLEPTSDWADYFKELMEKVARN